MKQWECIVCGWVYDETVGDPDSGIAPGTKFEDIPDDWLCPECGVGKDDFELLDVPDIATAATPAPAPAPVPTAAQASSNTADQAATASTTASPLSIVIVGAGLAGYGLLKELRKLNNTAQVTIICSDTGDAYSKPALSTVYTKAMSADQLRQASATEMAIKYQANILTNTTVESIDSQNQVIQLSNASGSAGNVHYHKLVLATGAKCIQPPLQGNAVEQIFSINDLVDFTRFESAAKSLNAKKICLIGSGLIGCEYANDLSNGGLDVELVDPMTTCLPSLLPLEAGQAVQRGLESIGAKFNFGNIVERVDLADGGNGLVVTLDDQRTIQTDMVVSAIGVTPRTELALQAGLEVGRGIKVDATLHSSVENIYALGDCAEVEGLVLVYVAPLLACSRALAKTLSGNPTRVSYPPMPIAIKTPACPTVVCPPPIGSQGSWEIISNHANNVHAEFENAQGEVLGFALTGECISERAKLYAELPDLL